MTFAGWGWGGARVNLRDAENRTVARWSGNTSTLGTTPNRIGGAVPSMLQPVSADQPLITTLTNGVQVLDFDGSTHDLTLAPSPAIAITSPRLYWAFHMRLPEPVPVARTIWAEWGTTERFQISSDATSIIVTVALSAIAVATRTFPLSIAAKQAGFFLEVFYNGNAAVAADRIKLFIGLVEVTASGSSGTMPTTLLLGNAVSNWLGSLNGSSNRAMQVAHFWFIQGHPSSSERTALSLNEVPDWTFYPTQVPNLSSWLRVANATSDVDGISVLPDELNPSNPAVQPTLIQRPLAVASAGNGKPCMQVDGVVAIRYSYRLGNTGGDPANGRMRLVGSATQNLCNQIMADMREVDISLIPNYTALLASSTNPTKGFVRIVKDTDPTAFINFTITSVIDSGIGNGFYTFTGTVSGSSAANPFTDTDFVWVYFDITDNAGVIRPRRTMTLPLIAANNGSVAWGWAAWIRITNPMSRGVIWSIDSLADGASLAKLKIHHAAGTFAGTAAAYIQTDIIFSSGARRTGRAGFTPVTVVAEATWAFVTVEYNSLGVSEATKLIMSVNAVVHGLTFGDLPTATGAMGALTTPTGNIVIGNEDAAGTLDQFRGMYGPDIFQANARMTGASEGVWTPAVRTALMTYNQPT